MGSISVDQGNDVSLATQGSIKTGLSLETIALGTMLALDIAIGFSRLGKHTEGMLGALTTPLSWPIHNPT